MRKPVVLITGAGGEIGHGLIDAAGRGAAAIRSSPSMSTRSSPASPRWCGASSPARSSTSALLERVLVGVRGRHRLSPRGAALDALRVHAGHRAPGQRRRHAEPARVLAARSRVARPAGACSSIPRRSPPTACPTSTTKQRAGTVQRRRLQHAVDDVRRATSCTASSSGRYYARFYKQLAAEPQSGRVDFRCVRFPGPDLGADRAVRRHLRLRAGDDSRRGARASRTRASCGPTRASRSWRCPTASRRC